MRTADLLETALRVAEFLHQGLDLSERSTRLLTRLQVGVPGKCVEIAQILGGNLTRGDYQSLLKADLVTVGALEAVSDSELTRALGGSAEAQRKVVLMRDLLRDHRVRHRAMPVPTPLPPYLP
jgi:hypothetical protein